MTTCIYAFRFGIKTERHRPFRVFKKGLFFRNEAPRFQGRLSFEYCVSELLRILNYIEALSILVLLDLSSAFDTIEHTILINRLQSKYGITATVLDWIKSYLNFRTHSTVINDTTSDTKNLVYGVPQGSVLRPLLFS